MLRAISRVRAIRLLGAGHDLACATLALPLAFFVRLGELPEITTSFLVMEITLVGAAAACFYAFGLNQGSWRYASIEDLLGIIQSAVLATLLAVLATFAVARLEAIPRMVPLIACSILICTMSSTRLFYRVLKDRHLQRLFSTRNGGEHVLIVGYSDEASAFVRNTLRQRQPAYHVVGIIDHTGRHLGRRLHNTRVLGSMEELPEIVQRLFSGGTPISKIVVSPSKANPEMMEQILVQSTELGLPVFILPNAADLTSHDDTRPIKPTVLQLDDLLGRPNVDIDLEPIAAMLQGKTILVTGGGGSIGSGLVQQALGFRPARMVVVDSSEHNLYTIEQLAREDHPDRDIRAILADVRDSATIRSIMMSERPDIVFHAAALKHVPMVERNPVEGARTNILGTINVADAAVAAGTAAFVMISTDKAVNPTNVMGATKRFAEAYCQLRDLDQGSVTRFMTVRFGNVLGSAGSVVPLFTRQIARGGPVTVTHPDMKRYFMSIREAIKLVLAASSRSLSDPSGRGKIMVLNMGQQVRIVDIASRMIRLAGLRPELDIAITYTGLRPGEKLFEERLAETEQLEPTGDDWLQIARPRHIAADNMASAISSLRDAAAASDETRLLQAIHKIVPELTSRHAALSAPAVDPATGAQTIAFAEARSRLRT